MRENQNRRLGIAQSAMLLILGLVTACVAEPTTPVSSNGDGSLAASNPADSPVVSNGTGSTVANAPAAASVQHKPRYISVADGQTLDWIARSNHLSPAALAAANHLEPPYKLKAGSQLLVPDSEQPADHETRVSSATSLVVPQPPVSTPPSFAAEAARVVPIVVPTPPQKQASIEPTLSTASGAPSVLPPRYAPAALPLPGETQ